MNVLASKHHLSWLCKIIHMYSYYVKIVVLVLFQELCKKGGILFLAQAILKLSATPHFVESSRISAALSRLKAKFLAIVSPGDEKYTANFYSEA